MSRDASPLRYLPVHLRDVGRIQGLLFALASLGLVFAMHRIAGEMSWSSADIPEVLTSIIQATVAIATLMAAGGQAGVDRKQGYYRAYFSQPMAPWWYYFQRWCVGGVAVLTIPIWLDLSFRLIFHMGGGISLTLFASVALAYLLIGGAVLLVSTFHARDWLIVFILYFTQRRLDDAAELLTRLGQEVPPAIEIALRLLPPFDTVANIGTLPTGGELWHALGYGAGMVALALLIFHLRPLGSGGRA